LNTEDVKKYGLDSVSLIKRLQRLTGEGLARENNRAAEIGALRRRIDAVLSRRPLDGQKKNFSSPLGPGLPLTEVVAGEEITVTAGRFFCADSRWGGTHRHGACCLGELSPLDMTGVALLANNRAMVDLDFTKGVFLDTETTGLAGGAGTLAFLIGLGWFEGSGFAVKQLFMRDHSEERAVLSFLRELMADRHFLVTFNGKAFDVNLLAGRFVLNRLADPLTPLPHLDLLHPARRLLGHRLENVRLVTLEGEILGLEREGDIPGHEIPQRYFDWLRHRDGRLMEAVFYHNRLDVISMAALTARLTGILAASWQPGHRTAGPRDFLAAARLLVQRGEEGKARRLLAAARRSPCPETVREAGRLLSLLHKRAGEWSQAVALWQEMLVPDGGNGQDPFPLVELAKWCEHRAHDCRQALDLSRRALEMLPRDVPAGDKELLQRRIARLERRLARENRFSGD